MSYKLITTRDVGRTREEFVNHEPQVSGLQILRVFYQHPKWSISLNNPSNLFAHMTKYSPAKTGEYPRIFPNFENCARCEIDLKDNKDNSLHLGQNMPGYLSLDIICSS